MNTSMPLMMQLIRYLNRTNYTINCPSNNFVPNIIFLYVTTDDVLGIIKNKIKNKPSCSSDNISGIAIKKIATYTIKLLSNIINTSSELKISYVSPTLKKGDPEIMSNYRPVTVSPVLSKIFECHAESNF